LIHTLFLNPLRANKEESGLYDLHQQIANETNSAYEKEEKDLEKSNVLFAGAFSAIVLTVVVLSGIRTVMFFLACMKVKLFKL